MRECAETSMGDKLLFQNSASIMLSLLTDRQFLLSDELDFLCLPNCRYHNHCPHNGTPPSLFAPPCLEKSATSTLL